MTQYSQHDIAKQVQRYMFDHNIRNQKEIAKKLNVSTSTISRLILSLNRSADEFTLTATTLHKMYKALNGDSTNDVKLKPVVIDRTNELPLPTKQNAIGDEVYEIMNKYNVSQNELIGFLAIRGFTELGAKRFVNFILFKPHKPILDITVSKLKDFIEMIKSRYESENTKQVDGKSLSMEFHLNQSGYKPVVDFLCKKYQLTVDQLKFEMSQCGFDTVYMSAVFGRNFNSTQYKKETSIVQFQCLVEFLDKKYATNPLDTKYDNVTFHEDSFVINTDELEQRGVVKTEQKAVTKELTAEDARDLANYYNAIAKLKEKGISV